MQACAEQEATAFSSPTCPHADQVPDTQHTNVITFLPHFCRAAGVGHEGDHALRTIRRHNHRDWETV